MRAHTSPSHRTSRRTYAREEITAGLVLWFEPRLLRENGAKASIPPEIAGDKRRPFLCFGGGTRRACWFPLYSRPYADRLEVPRESRSGDVTWLLRETYIHTRAAWIIPYGAIAAAHYQAWLPVERRNTLHPEETARLLEVCRYWAARFEPAPYYDLDLLRRALDIAAAPTVPQLAAVCARAGRALS